LVLVIGKPEQEKTARSRAPRAQRHNQNPLWNYGKLSHLRTVPQYGGDRDGYTIDSNGPKKPKTKAKNSLDSEIQKRDNGIWYVTN
jgi:hypothetical protein